MSWTSGQDVIAEFVDDGAIYRGSILSVDNAAKECLVHFGDFGNVAKCAFAKIYKYKPQEFNNLPPLVC